MSADSPMVDSDASVEADARTAMIQQLAEHRLGFLFKLSTPILIYYEIRTILAAQFYSTIINTISLLILLAAMRAFYKGRSFELGSKLYIAGLLVVVGISPLVDHQMDSPTMWLLTLVPVISGHLRGARSAIRLAFVSLAILGGIWGSTFIADIPPEYPSTVFDRAFLRCFAVLVAAGLGLSAYKSAKRQALKLDKQGEALKSSQREFESAVRAKSVFLANMSHEIRTPLNGMLGMTQFLQSQPHSPHHRACIDKIHHSGEKLLGILNDVLDLSKLEAGRFRSFPESFELSTLRRDLLSEFDPRAKQAGITLHAPPPQLDFAIISDQRLLFQASAKLLDNALKHAQATEIWLTVACEPSSSDPNTCELHIQVEDNGCGIDPQISKGIHTEHGGDELHTDGYHGAGLGLPLVLGLTKQLRGKLHIRRRINGGTCAELRFTPPIATSHKKKTDFDEKPAQHFPIDVLVVDDVEINRMVAQRQLELQGCRVLTAESGQQALDHLKSAPVDFALVDIHMPEMDGYELTRRIRAQQGPHQRLPIIALTAGQSSEYKAQCLAAGMDDLLSKPFKPAELIQLLAKYGPRPEDKAKRAG